MLFQHIALKKDMFEVGVLVVLHLVPGSKQICLTLGQWAQTASRSAPPRGLLALARGKALGQQRQRAACGGELRFESEVCGQGWAGWVAGLAGWRVGGCWWVLVGGECWGV